MSPRTFSFHPIATGEAYLPTASFSSWLDGDSEIVVAASAMQSAASATVIAEPGPFVGAVSSTSQTVRHELIFVNSDVPNYRALLRDLTADASQSGRIFEVVIVNADRDGLEQITAELLKSRATTLDAVHFVTHASAGAVKFGNTWIDATEFAANRERIESWRQALSADADLLFYGCDLAGTAAGQRLLSAFYDATGADIAASDDRTGAAHLGGDWELEFQLGAVETGLAFSRQLQTSYDGVLATFIVTTALDSGPGSFRDAIDSANAAAGADTIVFAIGSGLQTINVLSALPTITDEVVIDATSQPGFAGTPLVELRGTLAGAASGLQIDGNNVTVRGFIINDFKGGGIDVLGSGHVIQGNYIGTDSTGFGRLSNSKHGIRIGLGGAASNITVGGTTAGAGNIIAFNKGAGVDVRSGTGVTIRGNAIFENNGLAIDLGGNGVTANDIGDVDVGENNLQNFPVLSAAVNYNDALLTVTGTIRTTPTTFVSIDFYSSPLGDPSGFGEGATYIGSMTVTTDANGFANIVAQFAASIPLGSFVSATATNSTGDTSEFGAVIAVTPSSPGSAIWVPAGVNTPEQSPWDGTAFGLVSNTSDVQGSLRVIQGAEAPTRDELIVLGVDNLGVIRGQMWDGSTWTMLPFSPLATLPSGDRWSATVVYETQSGDALLIWANGSSGTEGLSYRVWDGTSWSAEQTITTPIAGAPNHIRVASNPNRDELTLVVATDGPDESALIWDGSSWANGIVLDTTGAGGQQTEVYATYESQSGHALIVFDADAPGNTLQYRIWDGVSWSVEQSIVPSTDSSSDVRFSVLAADQYSDRIALGVISSAGETWFLVWDGSAWGSELIATLSSSSTSSLNVAVAFEGQSGDLLAAYGEAGAIRYRTWSSGGGWSAEMTGPNLGGNSPKVMTLAADPLSDQIMLAVQDSDGDDDDSNNRLTYANWTGTSWGSATVLESNTGVTSYQPFLFLWDSALLGDVPPNISIPGGAVSYVENGTPVIVAPTATVTDTDSADFDTGTLTVGFVAGGSGDDRLAIRNQGAGIGQIGVVGSTITYGGVAIGTFSGGVGLVPLVVTFNASATVGAVEATVRNVTFANVSDNPPTISRDIQFALTDGDSSTSDSATVSTIITAVNDAPTWAIPVAQSTTEDTPLVFSTLNGNRISVSDVDVNVGIIEVTISVTNGTVTLNGTTGLSFSTGDGIADAALQFTGTISAINFALDGMTFTPVLNFNGGAALDLLVDDLGNTGGGSLTAAASVGINVIAGNDRPVITANTLTIAEGQTVTLTPANLAASDVDNSPAELTFAISALFGGQFERTSNPGAAITSFTQSDVNAGLIVFVHNGGELAPSYDVTVSDGSLSDGPHAATINFSNVNDPPVIGDQVFTLYENTANGTPVATIIAADPDTGDVLTFSITSLSAPGAFGIDPATGRVFVAEASVIDYEATQAITLTVIVQDSSGATDSATVTAFVQNINEFTIGPIVDNDSRFDEVTENSPGDSVGITAFADDLDGPDVVAYSLDNDADGRFVIDPTTGVIYVARPLDFETEFAHFIVARATSSDGSSTIRSLLVRVVDQLDILLNPPEDLDPTLPPTGMSRLRSNEQSTNQIVIDGIHPIGPDVPLGGGLDTEALPKNLATTKGPPRRPDDAVFARANELTAATSAPPPVAVLDVPAPPMETLLPEKVPGAVEDLRVQFADERRDVPQPTSVRTSGIMLGTGSITLVGVGSVLLQTRLGAMLMSLISSAPMWRQFDPLSVLNAWERDKRKKKSELEKEDQSLAPILG